MPDTTTLLALAERAEAARNDGQIYGLLIELDATSHARLLNQGAFMEVALKLIPAPWGLNTLSRWRHALGGQVGWVADLCKDGGGRPQGMALTMEGAIVAAACRAMAEEG